ncbi:MAG: peptidoglycan-binding domain-containing protein, partial [Minisyncoccia bacterium]
MKKLHIALLIGVFIIPSVSFASIDTNLKYGSRGLAVSELQDFLITKGFLSGQTSGNFFSLTRKAVIAYQASVGLPTTGFV